MSEIHDACRAAECTEELYRYGFVAQRGGVVFRHRLTELVLSTAADDAVVIWLMDLHKDPQ